MWSTEVEKALGNLERNMEVTAGDVAALTSAVAQLLSSPLGVEPVDLQRCVQHAVQVLLDVCGKASGDGNTTLIDTAKDALQMVSWQMVLRGEAEQRVFLGKLLDGLRPEHPTAHVQRTALEVVSALCKAADSSLQPLLLNGLAPPLAYLMSQPEGHADTLKVIGTCAKQFAPYILPGGAEEPYLRLLEGARSLLSSEDDIIRRQAATAVAAVLFYGRPCRVEGFCAELSERYAELDLTGGASHSSADIREAKGIALALAELARSVVSESSTLPHALVPMLRAMASIASDVVGRFTNLALQDISMLTAVLDAFDTVHTLLTGNQKSHILQISGWQAASVEQVTPLADWLRDWRGRGFETAVISCVKHIGILSLMSPEELVGCGGGGGGGGAFLTSLAGHDDTGVRCETLIACGRAASGMARIGRLPAALSYLECVAAAQSRSLHDAHRCAYTQRACLQALAHTIPSLLKSTDTRCFATAQTTLHSTLAGHAAARELGTSGRAWTVQVEILALCEVTPWRLMTDAGSISSALWWCATLCWDPDGRVRARACQAFTLLLAKLPFAVEFSSLAPPNRRAAAGARIPPGLSGHSAADCLLRAKDLVAAGGRGGWHADASLLIAEDASAHNIAEALCDTLRKLAGVMGGMGGAGALPDAFSGTLRILGSIAREYGHHGGEYRSILARHGDAAVGLLLRALRLTLQQPHLQVRLVSEIFLATAGFVSGSTGSLSLQTYRTLLVQVALQYSLVTAALAQRLGGVDAQCPPSEILRATESQLSSRDLPEGLDVSQAFVDEGVVRSLAAAKAVAHKAAFRPAGSDDAVPEGFAGICESSLTLLASLVEEASDQHLVCCLTDALLRVVALHRNQQPKLVLDLLRGMFRASYGHPDVHRQRVPLPIEFRQPVGSVRLARALKASPNQPPLSVFLNPILESVQLYFRSMDVRVQPAVVRLLYALHCRGVDFSRLDPTREIAKRLRVATERQLDAWTGRDDGDGAQATPPIVNPVPLLRLLHQITPAVAKGQVFDGAEVARNVLSRAAQSHTPQLAESLLPYLVGVGRKEEVVEFFLNSLQDLGLPCGGYTISLCVQLLRAAKDRAGETGEAPPSGVKFCMLRVMSYISTCCELDWIGADHGTESIDALSEACRIIHHRLPRGSSSSSTSPQDPEVAAAAEALSAQLLASGSHISLAAALSLSGGAATPQVAPALAAKAGGGATGSFAWLEKHASLRTLGLLEGSLVPPEVLEQLLRALLHPRQGDARVAVAAVKLAKRCASASPPLHTSRATVFRTTLSLLETLLLPWLCGRAPPTGDGDVPEEAELVAPQLEPPVPSCTLLQAALLYDLLLHLLSGAAEVSDAGRAARRERGAWWQSLLTSPACLMCCFLRCEKDGRSRRAVVRAVASARGGVAHPLIDAAAACVAESAAPTVAAATSTPPALDRVLHFLTELRHGGESGAAAQHSNTPTTPAEFGPRVAAFLRRACVVGVTGVPHAPAVALSPRRRRGSAAAAAIAASPADTAVPADTPATRASVACLLRSSSEADLCILRSLAPRLQPEVIAQAAAAVTPCKASLPGLGAALEAICGTVCQSLSRVLHRRAAAEGQSDSRVESPGLLGDTTTLRSNLDALGIFLRDHLASLQVSGLHLHKAAHMLLVSFCAAYDGVGGDGLWEPSTAILSLFAAVNTLGPPELDFDVLQQACPAGGPPDDSGAARRCLWGAISETSSSAVADSAAHEESLPQILLAAVPQDVAWVGFTTRAAHHFAVLYGLASDVTYDKSCVASPPEAVEIALQTCSAVLLNLSADDRRAVGAMVGFEVMKAAPSAIYRDIIDEAAFSVEDGVGIPQAVSRILIAIAGIGCPKPWDAILQEKVITPLLSADPEASGCETHAACVPLLTSLLSLGSELRGPVHAMVPFRQTDLSPHPLVLTQIMSYVGMLTQRESSGQPPWSPSVSQKVGGEYARRNVHWGPAIPSPESHACNIERALAAHAVKVSEIFSKAHRLPCSAVADVLSEVSVAAAFAPGVFADHAAVLTQSLNGFLDRLPKETVPLRDYFYGLQAEDIRDGLPECYNTPDGDTPSALTCSDPLACEAVAVAFTSLGTARDVSSLLTNLATSSPFSAPAVFACVAALAELRRIDSKQQLVIDKVVPALAQRIGSDISTASSMPGGSAFVVSGVLQMVASCVDVSPSSCESSKFTRNAWEALWQILADGGQAPRLSKLQTTTAFAHAYCMLLHYSLSHAQRGVIAALSAVTTSVHDEDIGPESPHGRARPGGGDVAVLTDCRSLMMLGVMLCAQYPALGSVQADDDVSHRQVLRLVEVLSGPGAPKQAEPVVAAIGFIVKRGLHWQQGLPLCLQALLLSGRAHRALLPQMLPRILTAFLTEQADTAAAKNSWAWVQTLLDGCSRCTGDAFVWTVCVLFLSVCVATGDDVANVLLAEAAAAYPIERSAGSPLPETLRLLALHSCKRFSVAGSRLCGDNWASLVSSLLENVPRDWMDDIVAGLGVPPV